MFDEFAEAGGLEPFNRTSMESKPSSNVLKGIVNQTFNRTSMESKPSIHPSIRSRYFIF